MRRSRREEPPLEWLSLPLLLALWQVAALLAGSSLFPTPLAVLAAIRRLLLEGPMLGDIGLTLARAGLGFVIAMLAGTLLGILLGRVRWADRLFSGWLLVGLNLPAIVVAIVLYIVLGLTETALVLAVVVNKVPLVAVTVREGVQSFRGEFDELARAFRMPFWRQARLIHLPQLVPFLLAAARTGLSLIWKIVLVFEVLGSDGGVGFRIGVFFQFFDVTGILAYTATFLAVVLAVDALVLRPVERRQRRWQWARG